MIMTIQGAIDDFLTKNRLRTVTDMIYMPTDETVVVMRKMGYRNIMIDVSGAASPSEAIEVVANCSAVY